MALTDLTAGTLLFPETRYLSRNLARTALSREKLTVSQNSSSRRKGLREGRGSLQTPNQTGGDAAQTLDLPEHSPA